MLLQVQTFYEQNPPDLILYDIYAVGGRLFANKLNRPAVRMSPHFAQYKSYLMRQNGVFETPLGAEGYRNDLNSFLASHGIRTPDNLWHVEKLNIHFIPREFQYCENHFDDRFSFVGALLDRAVTPTWQNTSSGRPIVLISGMSGLLDMSANSLSYYKLLIESLSDTELHCILSIGDSFDPRLLGQLPDHFEINQSASHLEILPHAAISVCHGGMLSTLEALYNGVPVLSIPNRSGTEDEVASRNVELGGGRKLVRDTVTAEGIRETITEMLHGASLRCRVAKMQDMFRKSGGARLAADQIELSAR
jgi:MGT family glycosyltransferase